MKDLFAWMSKLIKKFTIWDIAAVKVMALTFGFIAGLFMPKTYRKILLAFSLPVIVVLLPLFIYRVFLISNDN